MFDWYVYGEGVILVNGIVLCSENEVGTKYDLFPQILKEEAVSRLYELGKVSDADNYLERTFQSPASVRAGNRIRSWMEDAGLRTWIDQMGNVHGRVEGINPSGKALLIGSHLDTVIDAGYFDGALGIITAISALKVLKTTGRLEKLSKPVEVIAFSDEEGVRFQSTFLGSAAIAGTLPVTTLHIHDKGGVTLQSALRKNSLDITEENLLKLKYDQESVSDYIEVHIEQGPVLENLGLPLGLVKGIAGQTRLKVTVRGTQGHAGTVPMAMRQDPMVASAELIVLLENLCKQPEYYLSYDDECPTSTVKSLAGSLVCTVGEISTWPSASNVIPGQASFQACLDMMQMQCRYIYITIYLRKAIQRSWKEILLLTMANSMLHGGHDFRFFGERSTIATIGESFICNQMKYTDYRSLTNSESTDIDENTPVLDDHLTDRFAKASANLIAQKRKVQQILKIGRLGRNCRQWAVHHHKEHCPVCLVWALATYLVVKASWLEL
nr:allantoate deiminase [Ipomoea batatas]